MSVAFLGLGSNLGDRRGHLAGALRRFAADPAIRVILGSSVYETKPVGVTDQPDFLNLVLRIETSHSPSELLARCLGAEQELGRERRERWGPRTIDLDVLLYDEVRSTDGHLLLPHPRMTGRGFVMIPLAEIAPDLKFGDGRRAGDLAAKLDSAGLARIESWPAFSQWAGLAPLPPGAAA